MTSPIAEYWCDGCGFENTSTGPCETCGWDDQAQAFDQDFIDERESWAWRDD